MSGTRRRENEYERRIGEEIRCRRTALGWSQERLAEACGSLWSVSRVSTYESGSVSMSIGVWHRIEQALQEGERRAGREIPVSAALADLTPEERSAVLEYITFLKWKRTGRT